ncbi:MAG: hypothetical protein ACT6RD_07520 [Brevundimonas sp.]|uniref:hypothetical protein n=1 Tax=Brevundimonas sp. TaxID=1871086 RepID=UPI0040341BF2
MKDAASHDIFAVAYPVVGDALRARTLAECLFWFQKAGHKIDGVLAVYKTGAELAKVLGVKPRTANAHMKWLAEKGFWRLVRKPRPGNSHPSPVTWFIPSATSLEMLERAREAAAGNGAGKLIKPTSGKQSTGKNTDLQMSVGLPSFQLPSDLHGQSQFNFSSGEKPAGKSKAHSSSWNPGKDAEETTVELLELIKAYQIQKPLQLWDHTSQYPWIHAKLLADALAASTISRHEWPTFVRDVHDHWAFVRSNLPQKYQNHPSNAAGPSSMPLGEEAGTVVALIEKLWADQEASAIKKAMPKKLKF